MGKFAIVAFSILASFSASADDVKFINSDGSSVGELCIAAIGSTDTLEFLAEELNISPVDVNKIACNGRSIHSFARKYRQNDSQEPAYAISVANQTPETQLCLAALTSEEEFKKIVDAHFGTLSDVRESMRCNGLTIKQFVRKYRDRVAQIAPNSATASI